MLRELLKLRPLDDFELYVTYDSTAEPLLIEYLKSLKTKNWELAPLPYHRRSMLLKCLAGYSRYFPIKRDIDILLTSDFDFHSFDRGPQLANLHDLSSIFASQEHCSLSWHGRRVRINQGKMLARSDVFVTAISEFSRRQLIDLDSRFENRSEVVHNGIEDVWNASSPSLDNTPPIKHAYWIWWGQITRRKNIDGLTLAYAKFLSSLDPETRENAPDIVLVGAIGRDSETLPLTIEQVGLTQRIHFFPFQGLKTLVDWVDLSDGVLFPSHFEGFGLPALEGLARGKPVMTSNCTSLPEITGGNAILVEPRKVSSIERGLHKLMTASQMNSAGQVRCQWASAFTYRRAAQQYSSLIDNQIASYEPRGK
ncbi:glycosyltransferase family 4 protein [Rhodopirellula sp. P2]|uniref:glycosyltransferase family 4 protein n=1 Tax=Rhodopirellula sp. P2 TaxID=2127060 RepID=UPI002367EFBC|nr:glycosyltransferase family 1 protein [Rhodopirellula sp. P2]WDQ15657.1 glycosyltransferase family 1 protein [Rhodopirellula sp. P2]